MLLSCPYIASFLLAVITLKVIKRPLLNGQVGGGNRLDGRMPQLKGLAALL